MRNCRCGTPAIILEVTRAGPNRGRWYLKCATGTCSFFCWDESPHSFIKHPTQAYAASETLSGVKYGVRAHYNSFGKEKSTLAKSKVHIVFTLLSDSLIGLKTNQNPTIDPVVKAIPEIEWRQDLGLYTLPATLQCYNKAISALPQTIPNLEILIDPIPETVLDALVEARTQVSTSFHSAVTEAESKWMAFVESDMCRKLNKPSQRTAVRVGIERGGRVLFGNENGIGMMEEAIALADLYKGERPILIVCPTVLCQTWKHKIMELMALESQEVCVIENIPHMLFTKPVSTDSKTIIGYRKRGRCKKDISANKTIKRNKSGKRAMHRDSHAYDSSESSVSDREDEDEDEVLKNTYSRDTDDEDDETEETEKVTKTNTHTRTNIHKKILLDEDSDEEEEENEEMPTKAIKVFVLNQNTASKRKTQIFQQNFRVVVVDASHCMRVLSKNESKMVSQIVQGIPKAILLSEMARFAPPIDLYLQIRALDSKMFPNLKEYQNRYCDPKNKVFGWDYTGRSNVSEFKYILNSKVWHCPTLENLKSEYPSVIRQEILLPMQKNVGLRRELEKWVMQTDDNDLDHDEFEKAITEDFLYDKSSEIKKSAVISYIEYLFETHRKPKIAIMYRSKAMKEAIKACFEKRKITPVFLDETEKLQKKSEEYNKRRNIQFVMIDLDLDVETPLILDAVDLAVFAELPLKKEKMTVMESHFKINERQNGPLNIKYLISQNTVDYCLWPIVKPQSQQEE